MELKSEGGIIIPAAVLPGQEQAEDAKAAMESMQGPPTLQLAEILEVGEGPWNQDEGRYLGSRFKKGEHILFRCGPSSQLHLDAVPSACGGKPGEFLIHESLCAGVLRGQLSIA